MSLSGGIKTSASLIDKFKSSEADKIRSLRIVIDGEFLVDSDFTLETEDFDADFEQLGRLFDTDKQPAFVAVKVENGWTLIQYVPDNAHIREKMLYASSRATLIRELGAEKFTDSIFATTKAECSLAGYRAHLAHKAAEAPRTEKEIEHALQMQTETGADIGMSTRKEIAGGVGFEFDALAVEAMEKLRIGDLNLVALSIDSASEMIQLGPTAAGATPETLRSILPEGEPFFVFFKYVHENEGDQLDPTLFFYICPPSAKVKSRMLFSSSRASTLEFVESQLNVSVLKKVELDSASEVDTALITDSLYPSKTVNQAKPAFKKPSRPGRK
ncbi:Twinfilin-1 [Chytriomyces hyalinus]|nr:Twinfilin-1 [Chytriomyces hyalinus]